MGTYYAWSCPGRREYLYPGRIPHVHFGAKSPLAGAELLAELMRGRWEGCVIEHVNDGAGDWPWWDPEEGKPWTDVGPIALEGVRRELDNPRWPDVPHEPCAVHTYDPISHRCRLCGACESCGAP